jgi:hypothetical protein
MAQAYRHLEAEAASPASWAIETASQQSVKLKRQTHSLVQDMHMVGTHIRSHGLRLGLPNLLRTTEVAWAGDQAAQRAVGAAEAGIEEMGTYACSASRCMATSPL